MGSSVLSLEVQFPARRYHATPWNHHVNEGVVEWPPSPWRLLRSLVATRHLKAREEVSEEQLGRIVEALAAELPHYWLPAGNASHTRHYMPLQKPDKTAKIFDALLHVDDGNPMVVTWPDAEFPAEDRTALGLLLARLGYLGRAESWAEARLRTETEPEVPANVHPLGPDQPLAPDHELVQLLAPLPAPEFAAWRARTFERELERLLVEKRERAVKKGKNPDSIKVTGADKNKLDAALPSTLLEALHVDTSELRRQGWSAVPGARWVDYARPRGLVGVSPARRRRRRATSRPTVARFAVASRVPPRLTEAVSVAERIRTALMSRSDGHPVFSGKDDDGAPLRGHAHAFVLPEANGVHGYITHVTVWAEMGFDDRARRAMDGLRKAWGRDGYDLQLVLIGMGRPEDFEGADLRAGQCPLFLSSASWVSRTPFVATRHPKTTRRGVPKLDRDGLQVGSPEHDLLRLLQRAGHPRPRQIEPVPSTSLGGKATRWLEFGTRRASGGGRRGAGVGAGFRLVFDRPVRGPIALGYAAHFGLGMFVPEGVLV